MWPCEGNKTSVSIASRAAIHSEETEREYRPNRFPCRQSPRRHRPPQGTPHRPHLCRGDGQDRCAGGGRVSPEISERAFEEAIECGLLQYGPDACKGDATGVRETPQPYGENSPGGYRK